MSDKLPEAIRSLQRAQESARRRLVEIDTERREVKARLKSLEAALKALGSGSAVPPTRTAPTTADVVDVVTELLSRGGGLSMEQLTTDVGDELAKRGKSRMGLRLRLEQAVQDERMVATKGGYELRTDQPDAI